MIDLVRIYRARKRPVYIESVFSLPQPPELLCLDLALSTIALYGLTALGMRPYAYAATTG